MQLSEILDRWQTPLQNHDDSLSNERMSELLSRPADSRPDFDPITFLYKEHE